MTLLRAKRQRDLDKWENRAIVDGKLNMSQQCALAAKRANCVLRCIQHSIASQVTDMIVPLCSALVWPHLEHCVQVWAPQYKKDSKPLESVQKRVMMLVKGLERKLYEEWLKSLVLFSLVKRRWREDLITAYSFLTRGGGRVGAKIFSLVTNDRI